MITWFPFFPSFLLCNLCGKNYILLIIEENKLLLKCAFWIRLRTRLKILEQGTLELSKSQRWLPQRDQPQLLGRPKKPTSASINRKAPGVHRAGLQPQSLRRCRGCAVRGPLQPGHLVPRFPSYRRGHSTSIRRREDTSQAPKWALQRLCFQFPLKLK